MKSLLNKIIIALIISFSFGCVGTNSDKFSFIIIQLNDVYEISPMNKGRSAGLARVATLRKQLLEENKNTITVMAGDFLSPSLIGTMKVDNKRVSGEHMVETLNSMGLDYATFGNHEFDLKENDLQKRLNESNFGWTSSNTLHKTDSGDFNFIQNNEPIPNHIIHSFKNESGSDFKLGIVSTTLPFNQKKYVSYLDPIPSFTSINNSIRSNCDAVIGLTHLDLKDDISLAIANPDLLMILGGHEHANSKNLVGKVQISKADANAKSAYVHRITVDLNSGKNVINSELILINDKIEEDVEVKKVVAKWEKVSNENLGKLGYRPDLLVYETTDTLNVLESSIRNQSTNFTKLVMQAFKYGHPTADVFLINSGSIRLDDMLSGQIYEYDILKTFPYGGDLVVAEMSGKMLLDILNAGLNLNKNTGGYLQLAGVSQLDDTWVVKDKSIQTAQIYKVLLPSFVAAGREQNLAFIKDAPSTKPEFLGPNKVKNDVRDMVIDYLKSLNTTP